MGFTAHLSNEYLFVNKWLWHKNVALVHVDSEFASSEVFAGDGTVFKVVGGHVKYMIIAKCLCQKWILISSTIKNWRAWIDFSGHLGLFF